MLRRNIDMEAGLVNGSMGTSRDFIYDGKGQMKEIEVMFDNGHQAKISRIGVPFELMKGIYVHRKQFPMLLSYSITIHKCQVCHRRHWDICIQKWNVVCCVI